MGLEVTHLNWDADLVESFAPSVAANPWGFGTAEEVLRGSHAFEYQQAGQRVLIAVRPVVRSEGTRLDVTGLVSLGDRIQAATIDGVMLQIAGRFGAKALAMSTMRNHVENTARRIGWNRAGVLMTKRLDLQ